MDERLARIRHQLPALQGNLYLNTGTAGPMPLQVAETMTDALAGQLRCGRIDLDYWENLTVARQNVRAALAPVLGCSSSEIALTHNTTEGMNLITLGLNWQPGDEAITTNLEHFGAYLPLYAARDRFRITVKVADVAANPAHSAAIIKRLITPRTKLIVVYHVSFLTGAVLPIKEICAVAHREGILVLVDGAQSFAALPLNMAELGCDFYAVPGQKWLCGPEGTGALYASQQAISQVQITFAGYDSVAAFNLHGGMLPKPNAERFEIGTRQPANLAGQETAARWLTDEVGLAWAYDRIQSLSRFARETFAAIPRVQVVTPDQAAGLVTIQLDGAQAGATALALAAESVRVRPVPWGESLRISTGFYNTEAEITQAAEAIRRLLK